MAQFQDTVLTRLELDGSQQLNEMGKLQYQYDEIKQGLKSINKYNEEYRANLRKLGTEQRKLERLKMILKDLKEQGKEGSKEYAKYEKKLKEVSETVERFEKRQKGLKKFNPEYEKQAEELNRVGKEMKKAAHKTDLNTLSMKQLRTVHNQLNRELASTPEYASKYKDLASRTAEAKRRMEELKEIQREYRQELDKVNENANIQKLNMAQLVQLQRQLNKKWEQVPKTSKEYNGLTKRLWEVNRAINKQREEVRDTRTAWDKLREIGKQAQDDLIGTLGSEAVIRSLEFVAQKFTESLDRARDRSDQLTDIRKTANLGAKEVNALRKELEKLDTRTSDADLLGIAKIGGTLGIPKEELAEFVKQADRINVALGDEFGNNVEETARQLGKLRQVFAETRDLKVGNAFNRIGSAINTLGNEGSVQAPILTEFAKRMGQLGNAGPRLTETLGLGAALTGELGFTAEIASGGLTALFNAAAKNAPAFARTLGLTTEEFKSMVNESPNEMLMTLARRFKGAKPTEIAAAMKAFGVETQEARKVLSALSDNLGFVEGKVNRAGQAFRAGTSLLEEFRLKNESLASDIDKERNAIERVTLVLMQRAVPAFIEILKWTKEFLIVLRDLPNWIDKNKTSLIGLSAVIVAFKFQAILAGLRSVAVGFAASTGTILRNTGAYRTVRLAMLTFSRTAKTQGAVNALLTASWRTLNGVMRANPVGFVITVVWLLVEAFQYAYRESETFRNGLHGVLAVLEEFWNTAKTAFSGIKDIIKGDFEEGVKKLNQTNFAQAGARMAIAFNKGYKKEAKKGAEERAKEESDAYSRKLAEETAKREAEQKKKREDTDTSEGDPTPDDPGGKQGQSEEERAAQEKYERLMKEFRRYLEELDRMEQERKLDAMGKEEREIERVRLKYKRLQEENNRFYRQEIISEKEAINRYLKLDKQFKEEKKKIQEKYRQQEKEARDLAQENIDEALRTERERELVATHRKYEALIEAAKAHGLEYKQLIEKRRQEIDAINQKWDKKEQDNQEQKHYKLKEGLDKFYGGFSQLMRETGEVLAGDQAKLIGFQKVAALAQMAIDSGAAMSAAIAGASKAAAATGPGAPFALAGYIASMIGTVLGAFGKVSKMISSAKEPTPPKFEKGKSPSQALVPDGPRHSEGGIGLVNNQTGEAVGEMEGGEPIMILSRQTYANNQPVIDQLLHSSLHDNGRAIMPDVPRMRSVVQYRNGGVLSPTQGTPEEVSRETEQLIRALIGEVQLMREDMNTWKTKLRAYMTYEHVRDTFENAQETERDAAL